MRKYLISLALPVLLSACVAADPAPTISREALNGQSPEERLADVEKDLIDTARERYGSVALDRALANSTYLIAKRYVGFAPPPPPDAGPDWKPPSPSALMIKDRGQWLVAIERGGWRPARADAAAELDTVLLGDAFWGEPALIPACPDYGSANLILKAPSHKRTIRSAYCLGQTDSAVTAALRA